MTRELSAAPVLRICGLLVMGVVLCNLGYTIYQTSDGTTKSALAMFSAIYAAGVGTVSGMLLIGAGEGLVLLRRILRAVEK